MKKHIFIIDTSAILSGKPINLDAKSMITSPEISKELTSGGKDYKNFQFLLEKGLTIRSPSKKSIELIKDKATETGDLKKLSIADIEILALSVDVNNFYNLEAIILSDDYSIQNVASLLKIKFQSINQRGILERYSWGYRCSGCKKSFNKPIKLCPICGAEIKIVRLKNGRKK